jgi:signal transduction histidine kinase
MRASRTRLRSQLLRGLGVCLCLGQIPLGIPNNRVVKGAFGLATWPLGSLVMLIWLALGVLIFVRQPTNKAGWIFTAIGILVPASLFAQQLAIYGLRTNPGSIPGVAVPALLQEFGLFPVAALPLLFLLFPNGKPPTPRWRWAVAGLLAGTAIAILGFLVRPGPTNNLKGFGITFINPFGIEAASRVAGGIIGAGGMLAVLSSMSMVVAVVKRFRRSTGEEHQQLRWLAFVGAVAGMLALLAFVLPEGAISNISFGLLAITVALGVPLAYAVAIFKYRLYELDVVIKKTVVFGVLALFITLVYAGVVGGVGTLVGSRVNTELSFAAATILAIAFQPARDRARRLADRLVYGKRASPYEVLTEFSSHVGESYATDDVLPRMARILGEGTGASRARVWLRVGAELRAEASWPAGSEPETLPVNGDDLPVFEAGHAFEVRNQGELLGALSVEMPASDPMNPANAKLVSDLASQAGLVLKNVRLIEELRASRQRLVAAQDEERRKIERNLHDGAQQQLVALAIKVRLAKSIGTKDPARAGELLDDVERQAAEALEELRDLARGVYPPLLADQGLVAALRAQARRAVLPVEIDSDGIGRYPQEVEAAAYFCCLEALQNVAKYADASSAAINLKEGPGHLVFSVSDDGKGFDPASTPLGTGLQGMADRLAVLGGTLELASSSDGGTNVTGRIPLG